MEKDYSRNQREKKLRAEEMRRQGGMQKSKEENKQLPIQ